MLSIALNTFREIVRNKFFGIVISLSVLLILLSLALDSLALGDGLRVMVDLGLSFIEISGLIVVILLAGGLITREIEGKTIYLLLSKPISRSSIIFGKFFGFAAVLLLLIVIEGLILSGLLAYSGMHFDGVYFAAILGIMIKLLILLGMMIFFSTVVSPGVAVFLTITSYLIGHGGYTMLEYASRHGQSLYSGLAEGVLALFPNLSALNLKNLVATGVPINIETYTIGYGLGVLYMIVVVLLAAWVFGRRSLKTIQ